MKARIEKILTYEATKSIWRKDFKSKEFNECSELNLELFGESLKRKPYCECVEIFFFNLHRKIRNNQITKIMEKKFVVKGVIMHHALSDALTKDSSDEDVIAFLSKVDNPEKHLRSFERYPSDWEQLISEKPKSKAKAKEVDAPKSKAKAKEVDAELPSNDSVEKPIEENEEIQD
jgi:hypothetical protein